LIRVAFILGDVGWTGGVNYYKNLLQAIKTDPNSKIQPVLFFGKKFDVKGFEGLGEIVHSPIFDRNSTFWLCSKVMKRLGRNIPLYYTLKKKRINMISHVDFLWRGCTIPSLVWIPDLQHLKLPDMFPEKDINERNLELIRIVKKTPFVLFSSQDSCDDFNQYTRNKRCLHTYILRFKSCIGHSSFVTKQEIKVKYHINQPWFYIPNQFWKHKNHEVVIEALKMLKDKGDCPLVICTGDTSDNRNPNYFHSLTQKISKYGLENNFRILGKVEYADVAPLMSYSQAIINPSNFEGWNTAVEEAKAMGKIVVLSDISVHKEQNPEYAFFFKKGDAKSLAANLQHVMDTFSSQAEQMHQEKAKVVFKKNIVAFAKEYESIALDVVKKNNEINRVRLE